MPVIAKVTIDYPKQQLVVEVFDRGSKIFKSPAQLTGLVNPATLPPNERIDADAKNKKAIKRILSQALKVFNQPIWGGVYGAVQ